MKPWFEQAVHPLDKDSLQQARLQQSLLTKPAGSLGRLEAIAESFAAWQGRVHPQLARIQVVVFAGDHGVCQQQVSVFPQRVTAQMVSNFLEGGAAISVLSRQIGAVLSVVNMGMVNPISPSYRQHPSLCNVDIAAGTADFSEQPAMTEAQVAQALTAGREQVDAQAPDLFIGGEMGIGNTTAAAAIYAALLDFSAEQVVGPGTGVDAQGLARKQAAVSRALALHSEHLHSPYEVLRCVGGLEIAGLVGSFIACAQRGIPVLVDGFIATAAALVAVRLNAQVKHWLLFAHQSAEPAHRRALAELDAVPLLDLGMRLGEGSGAALAVPLLQSALALHNSMATFDGAGVG
ncbi:MAG: nicotinate-nucleotide--dimethylbenzimidazole phosphoribosyltransferase [Cellvibrionaceae bacterium]|nr:nicotinate-nucleotide--dimethylbenzimidazole phosphoribosyltransferase [Cellvibrionaceae bacterium]